MTTSHVRSLVAVLLLFAAIPLMVSDHLPLHDYPNHLARLHMLMHWHDQPVYRLHYELGNFLIPNIAMDVVMLGLATVVPLELSGRIFIWLTLVLTLTGVVALHRALFGKPSVVPLVAALFLYNGVLAWGFINYLFGIGVLLWALALYIRLRSSPWQIPLASILALLLFFSHFVAFGLYGLAVGGYELQRAWADSTSIRNRLSRLCLAGLQFVVPVVLLFLSRTSQEHSSFRFDYSPLQKIEFLVRTFATYSVAAELLLVTFVIVSLGLIFTRRLAITINPLFNFPLILTILAFLLLPFSFFGSLFLDARIPICIVFLAIAASNARFASPKVERVFALGLIAVAILRFGAISLQWHQSDDRFDTAIQMFDQLQPNDVLITAASPATTISAKLDKWQSPVVFVAAYATIMRGTFVPSIFADPRHQPVYVAPPLKGLYEYQNQLPKIIKTQEDFRILVADLQQFRKLGDTFYVLLLNCDQIKIRDEPTFRRVRDNHRECIFRLAMDQLSTQK